MPTKWQPELLGALVPYLRERTREVHLAQWKTAGSGVFAADGSRVALVRSKSLEAAFAPQRRRTRAASPKKAGVARRVSKHQAAAARQEKATSPPLWLTLV